MKPIRMCVSIVFVSGLSAVAASQVLLSASALAKRWEPNWTLGGEPVRLIVVGITGEERQGEA